MLEFIRDPYVNFIILLSILIIASICDIRTQKIPNILILIGLILGFLQLRNAGEWIIGAFFIILLFFFSITGLIGNGDIKLWMVVSLFTGVLNSCFLMVLAIICFMIYGLFRYKKAAMRTYIDSLLLLQTKQPLKKDGIKIPFAPFMLCGYLILCLLLWMI